MASRVIFLISSALCAAAAARVGRDASSYANTTTQYTSSSFTSLTSLSSSPKASPSPPLVTASSTSQSHQHKTRTTNSSTTGPTGTCCYLNPMFVGVHTWWSSSVDVTIATAVTTWLQYNNTLIPHNSTVIAAPANATACYGTWIPQPGDDIPFAGGINSPECTDPAQIGAPDDLLPAMASTDYGASWLGPGTAYTVTSQNLTIQSPTPFFLYGGIDMWTSWPCATTTTLGEGVYLSTTLHDGKPTETYVSESVLYTVVPDTGELPFPYGNMSINFNAFINHTVIYPFPPGDYSNFSYSEFLATGGGLGEGPAGPDGEPGVDGGLNFEGDDMLTLPADLPSFLGNVAWVRAQFPHIAQCSNAVGQGEPTVHVPVNQLTATSGVTVTMSGNLVLSSSTKVTSEDKSTSAGIESTVKSTPGSVESTPKPTSAVQTPGSTAVIVSTGAPSLNNPSPSIETQSGEQSRPATNPSDTPPPSDGGRLTQPSNIAGSSGGAEPAATSSPKTIQASPPLSDVQGASSAGSPSAGNPASSGGGEQQSVPASNAAPAITSAVSKLESLLQQAAGSPALTESPNAASSTQNVAGFIASGIGALAAASPTLQSSGVSAQGDLESEGSGPTASPAATVVLIGSSTFSVIATHDQDTSAVIVANGQSSATVLPGSAATVEGQVISVPSSGGVAIFGTGSDAATFAIPTDKSRLLSGSGQSQGVVIVGSAAFTALQTQVQGSSAIIVANGGSSETLRPGSVTTLAGQIISAPSSGGIIVGTGTRAATLVLSSGVSELGSGNSLASSVVTIGSALFTAVPTQVQGSSAFIVADAGSTATIVAGSEITLGGVFVSAPVSGGIVFGTGSEAATISGFATALGRTSVFNFAGQEVTAIAGASGQGIFEVGSRTATLSAGGPAVTLGSQIVSEASDGAIVAQDGSLTTTVSMGLPSAGSEITVGGHTLGLTESGSDVIIGGQTLTPGDALSFGEETISLNSHTQLIVISGSHTSTETLRSAGALTTAPTATPTGSQSISAARMSPASSTTTSGTRGGRLRHTGGVLAMGLFLAYLLCAV